jgi:hypothetical protein
VPEIQQQQFDGQPNEPLAAPEPTSQNDSQAPQEPPEEPASDEGSQNKPPFEIKSIPQSEPNTPDEFTPSNREQNQTETEHGEY